MARFGWLAVVAALGLAPVATAQENVVKVYNWSDYIDPSTLEEFTAETGIEVVYDVFDSNETLETKLLAGSTGYDVVVPTGYFLSRQIQAGIFKELDKSKLANWGNLDKSLMAQAAKYDPDNRHAMIWMWGTSGIAYDVAKIKERLGDVPVDSWSVLLDPANAEKLADCGIYMLDSVTDVVPSVLQYLGEDPDSKDPAVLQKAAEQLAKVRPFVRKFHNSEGINALATGDICAALIYSGDAGIAATRAEEAGSGLEIKYVVPKEGAQLWFDMMAIPADASNPDAAQTFMNYMMRPEVIAKSSNFVTYPSGNARGNELVDAEVKADVNLFPDDALKGKLFTISPADQKQQRVMTRLWTQVTTGG